MFQSSQTANGIRVVSEDIPGVRSASISILVAASPQDEPSDKSGLAHFTEHAFFQGTSDRDSSEISRMIDESGGQMGAFTGRDYTLFYANVMDDYTPIAVDLLGDILLNSTFPEDHLEREREAILHEIEMSRDDPMDYAHDTLRRSVWKNHPLGRSIAGTSESVGELTREDIIYFTGNNYSADRIIIAGAGAIDHDNFVSHVQDAFWKMQETSLPRAQASCEYSPEVIVHSGSTNQSYFTIAFPAPEYAGNDRYTTHILSGILGGGLSSRLFRKLREESGLVYYVSASYSAYRDAGLFIIEGVTSPDSFTDVLELILKEVNDISKNGVTEEELWKAKLQMRGQHLLASDSVHTRMSRLATQAFYFSEMLEEIEILEGIDNVSCRRVQEVAIENFALSDCSLTVVGPESTPYSSTTLLDILWEIDSSPMASLL